MTEIYALDPVATNNNAAAPNGFPENMPYSDVNDAARELMAKLARFITAGLRGTVTTAGTSTAYTLISGLTWSPASYVTGSIFTFIAHATSTGTVTLNVDSLGAIAVQDSRGAALGAGDLQIGGIYTVIKTGTVFRLLGALTATSVQALAQNRLSQAYLATGTTNAIVLTTGLFSAYADGQLVAFRAANNNSGACTVAIDGLAAESLLDFGGQALATGDILTNRIYLIGRTSGAWRVLTSLPIDLATQVSGLLAVANGGTGAADAASARTNLGVAYASDAQIRAATAGVVVQASSIESASAEVALTDAATVALDWDTGVNFTVTLTANRVLGNPTNGQPGTWRTVYVLANDATPRTLTFGTQYLGEVPTITDITSTKAYLLTIYCKSATHFVVSSKRALG